MTFILHSRYTRVLNISVMPEYIINSFDLFI